MDAARRKARGMALYEPPGLWKEILPAFSDAGRRAAPTGCAERHQFCHVRSRHADRTAHRRDGAGACPYDAAIPLLSGEEKGYSNDSPEYFIGYRHLVAASIAGLNHMLPLKEMPSWTDFTFIEAYSFIHNAYPIAEKISEYNPSQLDDEKYYRRIVEIYQYINSDEIQKDSVLPLSEFRKAMKESTSRKKKPQASET